MQVLIIGSEGFIGRELGAFLRQQGHSVTGADIIAQTGDDYHQINAMDPDYAKVFADKAFDYCINASGQANVRQSFDEPKLDFDSNAVTVFRLLDAIRISRPTCKFLQLSSAAVYGNTTEPILKEDFPPRPFSPCSIRRGSRCGHTSTKPTSAAFAPGRPRASPSTLTATTSSRDA